MADSKADLCQIGAFIMYTDTRPDFRIRIQSALVDAGFIIADEVNNDDILVFVNKEEI